MDAMSESSNIVRNEAICCSSCGYRLLGLDTSSICPECGASVSSSVYSYLLTQSSQGHAWRGATTGVVYSARFFWSAIGFVLINEALAGLGGCVAIMLIFGGVISICSAGTSFRYERSDARRRWYLRFVGPLAIGLVIATLASPILLALLSGSLGRGGEFASAVLFLVWCVAFMSLHALVALGLRDAATELHRYGIRRTFQSGAAAVGASAACGLVIGALAIVDSATGRVPTALVPVGGAMALMACVLFALSNIVMWIGASRLRKHLGRWSESGATGIGSAGRSRAS